MFEIRIHGRGGQGVVTAAEMLSVAAFAEGRHSQAIPSFGSERMGAPVVAYVRIDDEPIEICEPVMTPRLLIVQDPTLFHAVDVFSGLTADGFVLVNTSRTLESLGIDDAVRSLAEHHVATVPATELAVRHLGRPTPNTALLGALTALTDVIHIDSVVEAIQGKFSGETAERNVAVARAAHALARTN
ncbi:MAG: 2-oxoacid:acceptor oxidoreductase family protein [Ectothiorhodospiraceae bacterium]|nr:2-oxoacid:acceptor oxidoreductase family protein [Ectothiorhodospiraceae bacterium]